MKFCMGKQAFVETVKWGLLKPEIILFRQNMTFS